MREDDPAPLTQPARRDLFACEPELLSVGEHRDKLGPPAERRPSGFTRVVALRRV
jgi:hypothetical protein